MVIAALVLTGVVALIIGVTLWREERHARRAFLFDTSTESWVHVDISADSSQFQEAMRQASASIASMGDALGGLGVSMQEASDAITKFAETYEPQWWENE